MAFFDVDETLITVKSMFRFLAYYFDVVGRPGADYEAAAAELREMAAAGVPRAEGNAHYYRSFTGYPVAAVAAAGQDWFDAELRLGGLLHPPVERALARHRARGDTTVLVSGSFSACLEPIRAHVGADVAVGTVPAVAAGHYTGGVDSVVIGPGKAEVARRMMRAQRVPPAACSAYGDHSSDLDLLESVRRPVIVGDDPVLNSAGRDRGWEKLPGSDPSARPPLPRRNPAASP